MAVIPRIGLASSAQASTGQSTSPFSVLAAFLGAKTASFRGLAPRITSVTESQPGTIQWADTQLSAGNRSVDSTQRVCDPDLGTVWVKK
jgi:hypothetical protein